MIQDNRTSHMAVQRACRKPKHPFKQLTPLIRDADHIKASPNIRDVPSQGPGEDVSIVLPGRIYAPVRAVLLQQTAAAVLP